MRISFADMGQNRIRGNDMDDLISRQMALDMFGLSGNTRKYGGDHSGYDTRMLYEIQDTLESLPAAQPEQHWIPVSERLPEESGKYLVTVLDGIGKRTTSAPYHLRSKSWTLTGRMAYWKVIAWMELPDPYRGGDLE